MILPLLAALAPLAPAASAVPQDAATLSPPPTTRAVRRRARRAGRGNGRRQGQGQTREEAFLDQLIGRGRAFSSPTLGGSYTAGGAHGPISSITPSFRPGLWNITLDDPGTGWQEKVLLGIPSVQQHAQPPLLVMFHSYSVNENSTYVNSPIFQDALDRGWFVLSPLGAHDVNFGIDYAQENVQYALDVFTEILNENPRRIYGIGFSMGGGMAMSYAARHQDPGRPRFAAVINHTGTVSVANAWSNSTDNTILEHELMFGGPPASDPFRYSQASALDIAFPGLEVDATTDLTRNLAGTHVLHQHADFDPITYLIEQTQTIYAWMELASPDKTNILTPNQAVHEWGTIDSNAALDYLYGFVGELELPTEGTHRVLADRETTWFHFHVHQDLAGAFTPFRWNYEPLANRLTIDETENLERIVVNTLSLGLNPAVNLEVVVESADGTPDEVTLTGYQLQPQELLRNGVADSNWEWDPVARTVTILESDPSGAPLWRVRP